MENKTKLRIKIKEIRKTLDIQSKSRIISEKIRSDNIFKNSQNIMLFYPTKYEVNLLNLICAQKTFYFPKVHGNDLLVCPNCQEFTKSKLGIYEPTSEAVNPNILDLIIVPALAVDSEHYRLGYGGGYYDRFLGRHTGTKTLTPIFKEFIIDKLPKYNSDIKIDYIISD